MPTIEVGDWVQDWGGDVFRWRAHHAARAAKHPSILTYVSQVRKRDGRVWMHPDRSEVTGAVLKGRRDGD